MISPRREGRDVRLGDMTARGQCLKRRLRRVSPSVVLERAERRPGKEPKPLVMARAFLRLYGGRRRARECGLGFSAHVRPSLAEEQSGHALRRGGRPGRGRGSQRDAPRSGRARKGKKSLETGPAHGGPSAARTISTVAHYATTGVSGQENVHVLFERTDGRGGISGYGPNRMATS
jgi:hypothetical protein